jgi:E3 ubiquitin-protein ligase DOA10
VLTLGRIFHTIQNNVLSGIKVVIFIITELIIFPFYCGVLINFCTLPFFNSSIGSRYAFYFRHPIVFIGLHWIVGTTWMYMFAMYVGITREIMRPGVLWFIKDPNDPNFHALRDIINRPILTQFRKLFLGAWLYGIAIFGVVGLATQIIIDFDYALMNLAPSLSMYKMFPLRLEY